MHKDEAAKLFGILSNGNRVKICKKLYNHGPMDYLTLQNMFDDDIKKELEILLNNGFISYDGVKYFVEKEFIDNLMKFISTPCGCR